MDESDFLKEELSQELKLLQQELLKILKKHLEIIK